LSRPKAIKNPQPFDFPAICLLRQQGKMRIIQSKQGASTHWWQKIETFLQQIA
jgi:hypothetical protein